MGIRIFFHNIRAHVHSFKHSFTMYLYLYLFIFKTLIFFSVPLAFVGNVSCLVYAVMIKIVLVIQQ